MTVRYSLLAALLLVACGDDSTTTAATNPTSLPTTANPPTTSDPSGTAGTDPTGPTSTTAPAEGAPVFLSFVANVATLTQDETVTFTAILTDPDGVADIVGGSLYSADESLQFGAFTAEGQPGTYTIALSWAQIHQTDPIEFEGGELPRGFRAVFFDQAANKATSDVELKLVCAGGAACGGACTDLAVDGLNCGTCGHVCDGGENACGSGACLPAFGPCVGYDEGLETCAAVCQAAGETCVAGACDNNTVLYFDSSNECEDLFGADYAPTPCDQAQLWTPNAMYIRCCCTDTK